MEAITLRFILFYCQKEKKKRGEREEKSSVNRSIIIFAQVTSLNRSKLLNRSLCLLKLKPQASLASDSNIQRFAPRAPSGSELLCPHHKLLGEGIDG